MKHLEHYKALKETLALYSKYTELYSSLSLLNEDEVFSFENKYYQKISESFYTEYSKNFDKYYFFGCSYEIYKNTYKDRFKNFQSSFKDSNELDFIKSELEVGIYNHEFKNFISDYEEQGTLDYYKSIDTKIYYSLDRRLEFLKERAIDNYFEFSTNNSTDNYILKPIEKEIKKPSDYLKIGALIAQNKIKFDFKSCSFKFNGGVFNKAQFEKILKEELGINSVRQYIESTFTLNNDAAKNLLKNRNKIKKIIEYCDSKNITITEEYRSLLETIE